MGHALQWLLRQHLQPPTTPAAAAAPQCGQQPQLHCGLVTAQWASQATQLAAKRFQN
jgi:hypothetical protein